MNAYFLIPPYLQVLNSQYKDHINSPVNVQLVRCVSVSRQKYYPDNEGIPIIVFTFDAEHSLSWYFSKNDETIRDHIYMKILEQWGNG